MQILFIFFCFRNIMRQRKATSVKGGWDPNNMIQAVENVLAKTI